MTRVLIPDDESISEAADAILSGHLVIYPTETSYGLAALALNAEAVRKVSAAKSSGPDKPMACIVADEAMLNDLTGHISADQRMLMEAFWPGPLTILFKAVDNIPTILHGGSGKIGARISTNDVAARLVKAVGAPITSTSANIHKGAEPFHLGDIPEDLKDKVEVALDAGKLGQGQTSTVIDVEERKILRAGAVSSERIMDLLKDAGKRVKGKEDG